MIDTNIAIHARDGDEWVLDRLLATDAAIVLSALSLAELQLGLYKNPTETPVRRPRLELLLRDVPVLPFDSAAAEAYGAIIAGIGWVKGRDYDRMIAGHAISTASALATANVADFRDIPGLDLQHWTAPSVPT